MHFKLVSEAIGLTFHYLRYLIRQKRAVSRYLAVHRIISVYASTVLHLRPPCPALSYPILLNRLQRRQISSGGPVLPLSPLNLPQPLDGYHISERKR
jgi:hypothetical protein